MTIIFLHGLDSSSKGTKAKWFAENCQEMLIPDFTGSLINRMKHLGNIVAGKERLVLIGSSFGGLMATLFAQENPGRVEKIILLAPALNFPDFAGHAGTRVDAPTILYIGQQDTVCPPDKVISVAQRIFSQLTVHLTDDDHLLRQTFHQIDWASLLEVR